MHIAFLNPQGNFDPQDSYWTQHPDFGGQLVYVKQVALAMGGMGHRVDILTRQVVDAEWSEFAERFDAYPGAPNVRIVRVLVDVVEPPGVEGGSPADHSPDFVSFREQQFGQVRPILPRNSGDQGSFPVFWWKLHVSVAIWRVVVHVTRPLLVRKYSPAQLP